MVREESCVGQQRSGEKRLDDGDA
nr:unnamed protein product [Callosobruchus analis]